MDIGRGLPHGGGDTRLGTGFLPSALEVLGAALDDRADRTRDLAIGLAENATGGDQFGIDHDAMVIIVGRLDEEFGGLAPGLAQLVAEAGLLVDRNPLV